MTNLKVNSIPAKNRIVIEKILRDFIGADPAGIEKMAPKTECEALFVDGLKSFETNILKQELLSIGGECAIPRYAILEKRATPALIIADKKRIRTIASKLKAQSFSNLKQLGQILSRPTGVNRSPVWKARGRNIDCSSPVIMGIVNATPDSFSGDGVGKNVDRAIKQVEYFLKSGAGIIDIGGESSRPGAKPVGVKQEMERVLPVIRAVKKKFPKAIVSIDTRHWQVAEAAIDAGVHIINDITGMSSVRMRKTAAKAKVGVVIMHMKGTPKTMQHSAVYDDVVKEVYEAILGRINLCERYSIERNAIVIDPGIGFAKTAGHNYELLSNLAVFALLERPVMVGLSRKSFIGAIDNSKAHERLGGTISANLWAIENGANIIRVHDVFEMKQALMVWKRLKTGN